MPVVVRDAPLGGICGSIGVVAPTQDQGSAGWICEIGKRRNRLHATEACGWNHHIESSAG